MRFVLVGEGRARGKYTHAEMSSMGLSVDDFMSGDPEKAEDMIGQVMDEVPMDLLGEGTQGMRIEVFVENDGLVVEVIGIDEDEVERLQEDLLVDELTMDSDIEGREYYYYKVGDLEDLIGLSGLLSEGVYVGMIFRLHYYEGNYYVYVGVEEDFLDIQDEETYELMMDSLDNCLSVVSEYGDMSKVTDEVVLEYGKLIENDFTVFKDHFR